MTLAEYVYTVVLKPKPLRKLTNAAIRAILPRTVRYGPVTVVLNPRDPVVSGALVFRVYEKDETCFLQRVCRRGMTVLDIGANVGYYTAMTAHAVGPEGCVIALEPDPENFDYLTKTIAANHLSNVRTAQLAASDHEGQMMLYISDDNRGDNRLYANELATRSISVDVVRIDKLLANWGVDYVNLIKIDVQGAEAWVLRGMRETIRRARKLTLLMEFWPDGLRRAGSDPHELLEDLRTLGLELHELTAGGRTKPLEGGRALIARLPGRRYTNIVARKRAA
jgi:FkbM family methyltransferase